MDKENIPTMESTSRITRSRAKALGTSVGIPPMSKPSFKPDQKRAVKAKSKRAASGHNENTGKAVAGVQPKRRGVLKDRTNILADDLNINSVNEAIVQTRKQSRRGPAMKSKNISADVSMEASSDDDIKMKLAEDLSKINMVETEESSSGAKPEEKKHAHEIMKESGIAEPMLIEAPTGIQIPQEKEISNGPIILNIDSNLKDPQGCSEYAPDIYDNSRVTELSERPSMGFMEKLQTDLTPSMRGILVDWLVEVSEEYKLVPDTLFLTVNFIDRFLSKIPVEKQRLQLVGVTCMLIASVKKDPNIGILRIAYRKYEEICAPKVKEFCFITDNTYTKEEVLKMESVILNFLGFKLSVPTIKSFLRRFLKAAQTSYKVPSVELEFLANYLAELTLVEYDFLNFLPSLLAASALFLARWTLNPSAHPWNQTLEYYTTYKTSELKIAVLALENLHLNANGSTLNASREKYKQQKFKCVANLTAPGGVISLF
ncbi:hypothetical protein ACFE04_016021 [Oxalis oulophora]